MYKVVIVVLSVFLLVASAMASPMPDPGYGGHGGYGHGGHGGGYGHGGHGGGYGHGGHGHGGGHGGGHGHGGYGYGRVIAVLSVFLLVAAAMASPMPDPGYGGHGGHGGGHGGGYGHGGHGGGYGHGGHGGGYGHGGGHGGGHGHGGYGYGLLPARQDMVICGRRINYHYIKEVSLSPRPESSSNDVYSSFCGYGVSPFVCVYISYGILNYYELNEGYRERDSVLMFSGCKLPWSQSQPDLPTLNMYKVVIAVLSVFLLVAAAMASPMPDPGYGGHGGHGGGYGHGGHGGGYGHGGHGGYGHGGGHGGGHGHGGYGYGR
ncbi:shematrin-like protein 2 [Homarus americanus]|uniref:shematrin-like protein 2 n=1 Tax=Homarus americanus TaxID=6706 RepID=UPI001C47BADC|nr:shematrin-like protein 2 [Homarus americanus]